MEQRFEEYFQLGEVEAEPSSFFESGMILLQEEIQLPPELRHYLDWKPSHERSRGTWHWFAPRHLFRLPTDSFYLIAQCLSTKRWLTWDCCQRLWSVSDTTYQTMSEVLDVVE
tara:strand:- start:487 stop:825 length:339 start_codon:yes stop_codon:yes gene_type:complete